MSDPAAEVLVRGDMVGDKPLIGPSHILRAKNLYVELKSLKPKSVIAICGPSGSGKSEIASLLGSAFIRDGRPAYVLSCDNYPWRPPRSNDAHRVALHEQYGERGLEGYLGTNHEIDFGRIADLVREFKNGAPSLALRIMDTTNHFVHNDRMILDTSGIDVLVLEGTWAGTIVGPDSRVFLETNFQETLEHRRKRARDPITPFGETVLGIEQAKLDKIKEQCELVVNVAGEVRKRG
ncbi:MAG: hypothetical protein J0M12_06550 [Deltaproteobacteria bacterium]|nr:hypothetical protein [Deltaproteobacteria bacterium]